MSPKAFVLVATLALAMTLGEAQFFIGDGFCQSAQGRQFPTAYVFSPVANQAACSAACTIEELEGKAIGFDINFVSGRIFCNCLFDSLNQPDEDSFPQNYIYDNNGDLDGEGLIQNADGNPAAECYAFETIAPTNSPTPFPTSPGATPNPTMSPTNPTATPTRAPVACDRFNVVFAMDRTFNFDVVELNAVSQEIAQGVISILQDHINEEEIHMGALSMRQIDYKWMVPLTNPMAISGPALLENSNTWSGGWMFDSFMINPVINEVGAEIASSANPSAIIVLSDGRPRDRSTWPTKWARFQASRENLISEEPNAPTFICVNVRPNNNANNEDFEALCDSYTDTNSGTVEEIAFQIARTICATAV